MGLSESICYQLNKHLVVRRDKQLRLLQSNKKETIAGGNPAILDTANYAEWRNSELLSQYDDHFPAESVRNKRVLDFGCGEGALSFHACSLGASSVHGVDVIKKNILNAQALADKADLPVTPQFSASGVNRMSFQDNSFDVILCFDVVEHIMDPLPIWAEWHRVLAPGGHILIWWQPYYHPYGHHLMSYVPMPWAHVLFSRKTLATTCHRIFHLPEYLPRYWDVDPDGNKLPDREFRTENLGGVNRLTISAFEKQITAAGFRIDRREPHPMKGPWPVPRVSDFATRRPLLREYLTAYMIYDIVKPA